MPQSLRKMPRYEQRLHQIPYPYLTGKNGLRETHRMAVEVDDRGNWYAFPTIQQGDDGVLRRFPVQEAMQRALSSGNFKAFGADKVKAMDYGRNYKRGTVIEDWKDGRTDRYRALAVDALPAGPRQRAR